VDVVFLLHAVRPFVPLAEGQEALGKGECDPLSQLVESDRGDDQAADDPEPVSAGDGEDWQADGDNRDEERANRAKEVA